MRIRLNRWHIAIVAVTTEIIAFVVWRVARRHRAAADPA
jgi:hypothetical protein